MSGTGYNDLFNVIIRVLLPFFKCHKRNIGIFQNKMKNKKYHTAVTIPKSNIKIDKLEIS
jgi:hypothetical protein